MTKEQQQVREWMLRAEQMCPNTPTVPSIDIVELREKLHFEECVKEFILNKRPHDSCTQSTETNYLIEIADMLADSLYVVYGTAVAYGIDLEPLFQEVHRSNMTKFIDGHRREDGKWIKGPSYSPANLEPILQEQMK